MDKYVCLCSCGQLRNGKFFMNNHKHYLNDYFNRLGYKIHLYFYFDLYETSRVKIDVNNKKSEFTVIPKRDKRDVEIYLNTMKSNVEYYDIIIDDTDKENIFDTYHLENYKKNYKNIKMIKTNIIYDVIILYRPDCFFLDYPIIPNDNSFIQCNYSGYNYCSDTIRIFKGEYLKNLIKNFELIDMNQLNDDLNTFKVFPENYSIELFEKSNMKLVKQNDFFMYFRSCWISYFKFINWEYYDDYINI